MRVSSRGPVARVIPRASATWMLPALFTLTLFTSATLLFFVQPMFARMALPLLGGSPSVWNTAVVFYETVLLLGYLYAHLVSTRLSVRWQVRLHMLVLALPLLALPIAVPGGWVPPAGSTPVPWLLALLTVAVGVPFFAVSTSSPLLQAWFARTGHRSAADPYFLYAASNLGSLLALGAYPLLLEPRLRLAAQSNLWSAGYALLAVLCLLCALVVRRTHRPTPIAATSARTARLPLRRTLRWVALAAVPSSLMLSVTAYLSTTIAPVPLLWVAPLGVYLLTFVLVFARRPPLRHTLMVRAMPLAVLPLTMLMIGGFGSPLIILLPCHLLAFFIVTMACHGALAADRPEPEHLTAFYLWMSAGGALGGALTALVAPLLFTAVTEYPIALVAACLLVRPLRGGWRRALTADAAHGLAAGAAAVALLALGRAAGLPHDPAVALMLLSLPVVLVYGRAARPVGFALGLAGVFAAGALFGVADGRAGKEIYAERSFFGISRVLDDPSGRYRTLTHGTTRHGMQALDPARRREPLTYYFPAGPIGRVLRLIPASHVGVVGLGTGTLACYQQPGQEWTYFEIDPAVVRIARDPALFTYLSDCAPGAEIVLGDARLSLAATARQFDLLVLDAYSADAIPVHLLTREALALYLERLAPGGVLAFHISNQFFDLRPVLGNLAVDAGLTALVMDDTAVTAEEARLGKSASRWAVLARDSSALTPLAADPAWQPLVAQPHKPLWTDDFASPLTVLTAR